MNYTLRTAACAARGLLLLLVFAATACAKLPPQQSALSGKRLIVTLKFRAAVNPNYHYYVLVNNADDQNAPGPIAVLGPPYGNGFATGPAGQSAFTDFVQFDSLQPQGYGLYHAQGDSNRGQYVYEGRPVASTSPDLADPQSATKLQFELDLSQIIVDANGAPLTSATDTTARARALRWLQMNVIATDQVPSSDPTATIEKMVDSLGDNRTAFGQYSFLVIDLSQQRVFQNSDYVGQSVYEPAGDIYGGSDPSLDLIDWSIEVRG